MSEYQTYKDDEKKVQSMYSSFDEERRLNTTKASSVEFLTTMHYLEKYLKEGDSILDVGAGTGQYSFALAHKGYKVSAIELSHHNVEVFKSKITENDSIDLRQGNALDLSMYEDESFDVVLVFGPLYHLHNQEDKLRCLEEAKRVCKKNGLIYVAFIAHDLIPINEYCYNREFFKSDEYDRDKLRVVDDPFVFHTVDECRALLRDAHISFIHEIATDGLSETLADKINEMNDESFNEYFKYHLYLCEKPELLGMTIHNLFICRK